ncbi:isochorismate synthase DhbC [Phytohalomonas tamaricis]|uniref:isochorismate synthase DhbC n=1 Tax=Phytohalomonas tamaricis TaxID=2081032 RepID=UPI000D0B9653|nr:isochorismate synthase DhbC [Phytohalomonas tamaricis]
MNPILPPMPGASTDAAALHLVDIYAHSDILFASPHITLLGRGVFKAITPTANTLSRDVNALLISARQAGHEYPIVAGAIPFDSTQPACLIAPAQLDVAPALGAQAGTLSERALGMGECMPKPVPVPQRYCQGVDDALARFARKELDKVVLSRALDIEANADIDMSALLNNLLRQNPHGYTFAIPLGNKTDYPHVFTGASPELLVRREGNRVIANPLAGSAARSTDIAEDERRAAALLSSTKDHHEHAIVIDAVSAALRPFCTTLNVPEGPELTSTETLWHLSTTLVGELKDPETTSLDLALAMHPTPAVCGHPTRQAFDAIGEIEPFERGFFTGMVGWCDSEGNGEWAVAIRCAEIKQRRMRLYAGAGVVSGSTPEKELAETGTKLRTMLNAMGIKDADVNSAIEVSQHTNAYKDDARKDNAPEKA